MEFRKEHIIFSIRTVARTWGAIVLAFLSYMLAAQLLGTEEESFGQFNSFKEFISFLLFPVCSLIGLLISWKWEGVGGLIILISISFFHMIRTDLLFDPMILGLATPGLLFILYWYLSKDYRETPDR